MTTTAALIIDNTAHIFDVGHIEAGDFFNDNALQYMTERLGVTGEVEGWHFAVDHAEMIEWLAERHIAIAA